MSILPERQARTILTLGPPHSGKSVFAYLLFRYLREAGDDTALIDCDIFGPTFRAHKLASSEDDPHIYLVPNYGKLQEDVPTSMFETLIDYNLIAVRERGIIVLDGLGKYSDKTEALLNRAECLVILCRSKLSETEMGSYGFRKNELSIHPFDFYGDKKQHVLKVTTHEQGEEANTSIAKGTAELSNLSRDGIQLGKVVSIPSKTCDCIRSIATHVRENWF